MEFLRTQKLLADVLPPEPAVVLDVGGAAGAHAEPLAALGYEVHLIDPVPLHVEQARGVPGLASVAVGDARALDWSDASVDAVLLLGPLYHLTDAPTGCGRWRRGVACFVPVASWRRPRSAAMPPLWTG